MDDKHRAESKTAQIDKTASVGAHVIITNNDVVVRAFARLEPACVIGPGVIIGQNAHVRTGAVVLQSVPPNAIVEGNPAQVVGYVNMRDESRRGTIKQFNSLDASKKQRPSRTEIGVGGCELFYMRNVVDARGNLTVGEMEKDLPFLPARYFAVYDVPTVELRGEHAHKQCEQFLICLHGSCRVLVDDGSDRTELTLDTPDMGVYMPSMIWGTQYRYSKDAVLLVFASHQYDDADYLRTYDEFLDELKKKTNERPLS